MRLILIVALLAGVAPSAWAVQGQSGVQAPSGLIGLITRQLMAELDKNGDQRVDRSEFKIARESRFAEADSNHDGKLSEDEFKTGLAQIAGGLGLLWSEQLFAAIDKNADGLLELGEVDATGEQLFALADQNGDGFVTPGEVFSRHASAR